jgi:hypothetical protein
MDELRKELLVMLWFSETNRRDVSGSGIVAWRKDIKITSPI